MSVRSMRDNCSKWVGEVFGDLKFLSFENFWFLKNVVCIGELIDLIRFLNKIVLVVVWWVVKGGGGEGEWWYKNVKF